MQHCNAKTLAALVMSSALSGCAAGAVDLGARNRDRGVTDGASSGGPDGSRPPESESCNGADDDLDTRIDEGCSCESGQTQACFGGEPSRRGVGACRDGVQTCAPGEFADWGNFACAESVAPLDEQCGDRVDNDCDGEVDEDCGPRTLRAYIKASNTDQMPVYPNGEYFGSTVVLSADGNLLAAAASHENSGARGIGGDQEDNSVRASGAVYVFRRHDTEWVQEAYIKASNTETFDQFGLALALSADGTVLAVGARYEDSVARGIDGDQEDNSAPDSGAVYVFRWTESRWTQDAYMKSSNSRPVSAFGNSVSVSGDGTVLVVGAPNHDIDERSEFQLPAGAAYVFRRGADGWTEESYIPAPNASSGDHFGSTVSISADGRRLAIGAWAEDSASRGIDGEQINDDAPNSGAAYVFARVDERWTQEAYIKASNTDVEDRFGMRVSLSGEGARLAVFAIGEDSTARGIGGDQENNEASNRGAVYVFRRESDGVWAQESYVKPSNDDGFRLGLAFSGDGRMLAVGGIGEGAAGAAYLFRHSGIGDWAQISYIEAFNGDPGDRFGYQAIALDHDGSTLAVGALGEASSGRGLTGDPDDNSSIEAGAVYVYR